MAAPAFDLLVLGDVNPDLVLAGGDVTPAFGQAEHLVDEAELTLGGSGAITAAGAARLGLRVAMAGVVGDDLFGRWAREQLEGRGVDTGGLVTDPDVSTGVSVILSGDRDRAILTHLGTIASLRGERVDPALLRKTRHVHVPSYFLQRALAPDLPALFAHVHDAGGTTSVDPNWDPTEAWDGGLRELLPLTDVFLPNDIEVRRVARTSDLDRASTELARSAGLVVVKAGAEGALAATRDGLTRVAARPIHVVDTTGAGDSFDAGFLAGWLGGRDLEAALDLANACGAISCAALGGIDAQPTLAEAEAFILQESLA
ncbi:MAG TPA: carbohydrate kinase family protein [Actinomycetota bacterium]